ncbi:hypothetical protein VTJ83DRAFT_7295 [Remersonia thermophila]|uniref:GP-PDE domain-containing protein n=1 Tax=Remersonia thermophila TaxID=72144 RepID=A0ABR4D380_9PEZI
MAPNEDPILRPGTAPTADDADLAFPAGSPGPALAPTSAEDGLPVNIGHRGYKAAYPENTMAAFQGAVAAGAHALETDLHLSRDGVVVLSHDATLKRCFGVDKRVADCDWAELQTLQTLRAPHEGMPRLADLLRWLAQPALDHVRVLLDVKTDDDPDEMLAAVAATLERVPLPPGCSPWWSRVAIGCWNDQYITLTRSLLPNHPIFLIAFSVIPALRYLSSNTPSTAGSDAHPGSGLDDGVPPAHQPIHFNMYQPALVGPLGALFRRLARRRGRRVLAWTVNDERWMGWCVRAGVDGVVTDEVARFSRVRGPDRQEAGGAEKEAMGDEAAGTADAGLKEALDGKDKAMRDRGVQGTAATRALPGWRLYVKAGLMQTAAMLLALVWRKGAWRKSRAMKEKKKKHARGVHGKADAVGACTEKEA